ncbi:MAG TPA: long-chain-acyl-CoA synthetase [Rhizomicrobium sp.]
MDFFSAISRESTYISSLARTFWLLRNVKPDSTTTIADLAEGFARKTPHAFALISADQSVTYAGLDARANRYANWARAQGVSQGDSVAIFMENRPDFIIAWLGLFKIGAIAALINTNLRGAALAHSLSLVEAAHLIVDHELADAYLEARALLQKPPIAWALEGVAGFLDLDAALAAQSFMPADPSWRSGFTLRHKAFYIFTSGTTGLPKAANISHMRTLFMMYGFAGALGAKATDRIYDVLPLYHSAGGICAPGVALTSGGSLVMRRRFSTHDFWNDCVRFQPTFFQYIGELCRYLVNAPPAPNERAHHLRAVIGNGMRADVWPTFQRRFAIPKIIEFYGATEGNVSMLNYDGKVGAVGRIPRYMRSVFTTRIVRFDIEHEVPVRTQKGFCVECGDNEIGECIGKIVNEPGKQFEGYSRPADTEKKILRDVFVRGDTWFRTGDLMKRDALGYFYFVDRIGDTFRWKGENVSTGEVSEALSVIPGVAEANVYGVTVSGHDGRAGMAALVVAPGFDPARLAEKLALPAYARPVFLRFTPELDVTGTFKQRKVDLVQQGFDPRAITDPLYVLDPDTRRYEPLDVSHFEAICSGRMKL